MVQSGIFRQIGTVESAGTNKAKTVLTTVTKFSPKGLAEVRKTLTNDGKRVVDKLYLICNPSDEAEYVDPCMYGEALTGGYVNKSFIDIEKIVDANCPKGKAHLQSPDTTQWEQQEFALMSMIRQKRLRMQILSWQNATPTVVR